MAESSPTEVLLTGSLAFLALLPAAIGLVLNYYDRRRGEQTPARELSEFRAAIEWLVVGLWMVVAVYFLSLDAIVEFSSGAWLDRRWLTHGNVAVTLMSGAILLVSTAVTRFVRRYFMRTDEVDVVPFRTYSDDERNP
jgi:hypothetical protein